MLSDPRDQDLPELIHNYEKFKQEKTILATFWEHYETVGVSDMSVSNCPAAKKLKCPPVNLSAPASPRHWCQRALLLHHWCSLGPDLGPGTWGDRVVDHKSSFTDEQPSVELTKDFLCSRCQHTFSEQQMDTFQMFRCVAACLRKLGRTDFFQFKKKAASVSKSTVQCRS